MKINIYLIIWTFALIGGAFLTIIIAPTTIGKSLLLAFITAAIGVGCSSFANYLEKLSSQEKQFNMNSNRADKDKEPNNNINIINIGKAGRDIRQTAGSESFNVVLNLGILLAILTCVVVVGLALIEPNIVTDFLNKELTKPENTNLTQ